MLSASQPWWHDQQHGIEITCKASVGWPGASMKARVKFWVRYGSLDVKKMMGKNDGIPTQNGKMEPNGV